jgi:hypothetical protein
MVDALEERREVDLPLKLGGRARVQWSELNAERGRKGLGRLRKA